MIEDKELTQKKIERCDEWFDRNVDLLQMLWLTETNNLRFMYSRLGFDPSEYQDILEESDEIQDMARNLVGKIKALNAKGSPSGWSKTKYVNPLVNEIRHMEESKKCERKGGEEL